MAEKLKFNLKACNDFINEKVEDYEIGFTTNETAYDQYSGTLIQLGDRDKVKTLLKKFVIEAENKSTLSKHEFLAWLEKRRLHWRGQQYVVISSINRQLESAKGKEKKTLELKHREHLNYFHYNYDLIDMMEKDVLDGYTSNDDNEPEEETKIYLIKDGKQVTPIWDYLNKIGFVERMKNDYKAIINPTHNFELLKKTRLNIYENKDKEFRDERSLNGLNTTEFETNLFCIAWLKNELNVIAQWLSKKHPNGENKTKPSTSTQIEILKYQYYVETEIENAEKKIGTPHEMEAGKSVAKIKSEPEKFSDIFINPNWERFMKALEQTEPKLLSSEWEFVGQPRKHKGVICSWIKYLQTKGEVKANINRSQLASVLNKELKNFDVGKDGKTFDNVSTEFEEEFKEVLIDLSK